MTLRRELTIANYDFWLDNYGVVGRERKALRRELRANLTDATTQRGWDEARAGLGSIKDLARQDAATFAATQGARWVHGICAAIFAGAAQCMYFLIVFDAFLTGADAAGRQNGHTISGSPLFFPGTFTIERTNAASGIHLDIAWWIPITLCLLTFVLVARPWRRRTR